MWCPIECCVAVVIPGSFWIVPERIGLYILGWVGEYVVVYFFVLGRIGNEGKFILVVVDERWYMKR